MNKGEQREVVMEYWDKDGKTLLLPQGAIVTVIGIVDPRSPTVVVEYEQQQFEIPLQMLA